MLSFELEYERPLRPDSYSHSVGLWSLGNFYVIVSAGQRLEMSTRHGRGAPRGRTSEELCYAPYQRERQTLVVARHGILCWNHAALGSLGARDETPRVPDLSLLENRETRERAVRIIHVRRGRPRASSRGVRKTRRPATPSDAGRYSQDGTDDWKERE